MMQLGKTGACREWLMVMVLGMAIGLSVKGQVAERPNILFIAVDDLNCDFGAYGNRVVKSPVLDQIAAEGVLFNNNHCQKAVCGPSRASVLSGFTPEHTGITGFREYLRDMYPDVVTLPQFFKNNGYTTVGMGKIHDPRNVSVADEVDLVSWTQWVDVAGNRYAVAAGQPVTESADVDDTGYIDGNLAEAGVTQIRNLAGSDDPFFLAVGFKKPHLPFAAPKKYWDMYDRDSISLAAYRRFASNDMDFVHNPGDEFRNNYDDVPLEGEFPYDLQRQYIHGYYACVTYIDTQIGKLISELKAEGVYDNTIIVIWGDHGFSLGDHTNWGKHTNFEYATRCPMIIKTPGGAAGKVINSPTELLDMYPTLVDLAGYQVPDTLDGNTLTPILTADEVQVKAFSVSQFRRGGYQGFALRSNFYQYVEWTDNGQVAHQQLFNFVADPYQTTNLYLESDYAEIIDTFSFRLKRYLAEGENKEALLITSETDSLGKYRKEHLLEFSVYGIDGKEISSLKDAAISIGPLELPTSNAGYAALSLQPGLYGYSISCDNYDSIIGTVQIAGDTMIIDSLERGSYEITIRVAEKYSGMLLPGIPVNAGDQEKFTGLDGKVTFQLERAEHVITIMASGYASLDTLLQVENDTVLDVQLEPLFSDVKFRLETDGVPVNNADVIVSDTLSVRTNSLGIANFYELPVKKNYHFEIEKGGFEAIAGSFYLTSDTTIEIAMEPAHHDVSFLVTGMQNQLPLPGAFVSLGDSTRVTSTDGKAVFEGFPQGQYAYTVENEGYERAHGTLEIIRDTTIEVMLLATAVLPPFTESGPVVYPNPSGSYLRVDLERNFESIILYDGRGSIVAQYTELPSNGQISLQACENGIYYIAINVSATQKITQKIIKQ